MTVCGIKVRFESGLEANFDLFNLKAVGWI